ncbi:MAG: hypothetical protein WCJ57_01665 [Candidatus Falkowbacteria bacterium]
MKIEKCIGDFLAVTAGKDEEITLKKIRSALRELQIAWIGAITKYTVNKENQMIHTWIKPKKDCVVRLNFKDCEHPYLMIILIRILNDWGYDVQIVEDCQDKLLFERSEIFYQEELSKMMHSQ